MPSVPSSLCAPPKVDSGTANRAIFTPEKPKSTLISQRPAQTKNAELAAAFAQRAANALGGRMGSMHKKPLQQNRVVKPQQSNKMRSSDSGTSGANPMVHSYATETSEMSSKVAEKVSELHLREQKRHMHLNTSTSTSIARKAAESVHGVATSLSKHPKPPRKSVGKQRGVTSSHRSSEPSATLFEVHPDFPFMPSSVPLCFTVGMASCLSQQPQERPTFTQVLAWLRKLTDEVAAGQFVDSRGLVQVRCSIMHCHPCMLVLVTKVQAGQKPLNTTEA